MKTLHLPLKKEWYEMISSKERNNIKKRDEFREE